MAFADQRKRKAAPSMQVEVLCHVLGIWLEVLIVLLSLQPRHVWTHWMYVGWCTATLIRLQVLGAAAYGVCLPSLERSLLIIGHSSCSSLISLEQGKKKSKFLEAYPMVGILNSADCFLWAACSSQLADNKVFKFLLFWWCVFVFAVEGSAGPWCPMHSLGSHVQDARRLWPCTS